ncbi:MAG: GtrA family protein [Caldilineaceae bacterium]|nr:GtrA family protein [Caldilineaceae bacterium]
MNSAKPVTMGISKRKETLRFVKFAFVGALGALTDFTILILLVEITGILPVIASGAGFCAAVLQNFLLNRWWTFPESRIQSKRRQILKFALVSLVGLGINLVIFEYVDQTLRFFWMDLLSSPEMGFRASYIFAKLFSIGVVLFWNFAANRLWTFKGL